MAHTGEDKRRCPTREDQAEVLIAHTISRAICQDRQRGRYHKCFTCAYQNPGAATPRPDRIASVPTAPPTERPVDHRSERPVAPEVLTTPARGSGHTRAAG